MKFRLVDRSGATPAARFRRAALMLAVCLPAAAQSRALGPFGGPAAIVQTDPGSLENGARRRQQRSAVSVYRRR